MKLATIRDGSRDGQLVVVSRDLTRATEAGGIARTLQAALDDWTHTRGRLTALAEQVELRTVPTFRFREHECLAPLPRAYQWADASAYLSHMETVRRAGGLAMPADALTEPLMYQGGSDTFLAPRQNIPMTEADLGLDCEGELAVVTADVPAGTDAGAALGHIALLMLANDVSLRALANRELSKGFGFLQAKPSSAFSPVAVTPDELGDAWRDGKVHLPLRVEVNGHALGRAECGQDMQFHFGQLIAHAARTRALGPGTIIGSGTVSNRSDGGGPSRPVADGGNGFSCLAELRAVEKLAGGAATTPFLAAGDVVRIEMRDTDNRSVFGAIEQTVAG
jgi:fumarylacetoacetate (FAA) hydrolase